MIHSYGTEENLAVTYKLNNDSHYGLVLDNL